MLELEGKKTMGKSSEVCFVLTQFASAAAFGQMNTASVSGDLSDATGAVIPHATVTLAQQSTGIHASATTNENGRFRFEQLPPGGYLLTTHASGFKQARLQDIVLHAGERVTQNLTLEVGEISQVVPVLAEVGIP